MTTAGRGPAQQVARSWPASSMAKAARARSAPSSTSGGSCGFMARQLLFVAMAAADLGLGDRHESLEQTALTSTRRLRFRKPRPTRPRAPGAGSGSPLTIRGTGAAGAQPRRPGSGTGVAGDQAALALLPPAKVVFVVVRHSVPAGVCMIAQLYRGGVCVGVRRGEVAG
jgi:hypothetical protein